VRIALAAVLVTALALVPGVTARSSAVSIVFTGTYVLDSRAGQDTLRPSGPSCVPGSKQSETESARWTITFRTPKLPAQGTVSLPASSERISGTHVWDERSVACGSYPAGHLVCRTHFVPGQQLLLVTIRGGRLTFHPRLYLATTPGGCKGQVYNEHPDCGARDGVAVTDFAFAGPLRPQAPSMTAPARTATFDVRRSRSCAAPGTRNPHVIHQHTTVRYSGRFEESGPGP
jgi:hypothetical protein